ncbi:response regulator [Bradyrhizobium sp. CB2312]|uniref:response regulator n=1 Tax=Bradyrhizobium sp. CB2312 TaxID=3039155 RepID=UPI0024B12305|nr:response regulator [Bradyrhizobium sp. CB2312]WFU69188.1 response regulator [Bradyrhizobium sp. CB2312]
MHEAPRILVVEDEYLIAMELEVTLRTAGYRLIGQVPDVSAALKLLKAERPDAAILDVNLDGQRVTPVAEVLQAVFVPFILASGYVAADLHRPSQPCGMLLMWVRPGGPNFSSRRDALNGA